MIRPLLLAMILLPCVVKGQNLAKVTQIDLRYNIGHYNFGDTGHYAKEEVIEFTPISKSKFVRTYYLVTKRWVANPVTGQNNLSINDTLKDNSTKTFSFDILQDLSNNLNSTKDNFEKETFFPYPKRIKRKEILLVAQKYKLDKWLLDEETGKIDKMYNPDFRKIMNYYLLDTFLSQSKPTLENEMVIIDAWNNLTISFMEHSDTTNFSFRFYNFMGQPFSKTINSDYSHRERFVNANANILLSKILPVKSLVRKVAWVDKIKEDYIVWYLKNKM